MRKANFVWSVAILILCATSARTQTEVWFHITDGQGQNKDEVRLSYRGSSTASAPSSKDKGLTKLDLPADKQPGDYIYLTIHSPNGLRILLPVRQRVTVPKSPDPEEVTVLRKGEKLRGPAAVIAALAYLILQEALPATVEVTSGQQTTSTKERREEARAALAVELEMSAEEIDQQIQNLAIDDPFWKAVQDAYKGRYEDALKHLKSIQRTNPAKRSWSIPDADFLLGQLYLDSGNVNEALEALKRAVGAEPDPKILKVYGLSLFQAGKFEQSLDVWTNLIKLEPQNKDLYLSQGLTFQKMQKPQESIVPLRKFLSLNTSDWASGRVYNYLGDAYVQIGDTDKALAAYRSSLGVFRSSNKNEWQTSSFEGMMRLYQAKPNPKVAIAYNEELLISVRQQKTNDKKAEALILGSLAGYYAQAGDDEKALSSFDESLKIADQSKTLTDGEYVFLLRSYAATLTKNKRLSEAQAAEQRAMQILSHRSPK